MDVKVSVIVPVYNVEQWLEKCMESLVHQTLEDIEIIVVNDGTPDNSQDIIDRYVDQYPNKVFSYIKENGGLSDARNYGLQFAKGEYIAFVDSDDYVDVTMYEQLYNKAIEENSEIVVCGYYIVNNDKMTIKSAQMGNVDYYNNPEIDHSLILSINAPYAWNKLVKKDLFDRTGILFPKGYIFEDICTMYPLLACAKNISKVNAELYYYIKEREGSITAQFNSSKMAILKALKLLNKRFIELGLFEEFKTPLVEINLRHTYLRFAEFRKYEDRKKQIGFVSNSFKQLNHYFPDWRENSGSYDSFTLPAHRNVLKKWYKTRLYWYFLLLLPKLLFDRYYEKYDYLNNYSRRVKKYYVKCCENIELVEDRVLVESFHGKNISDSPYYMLLELIKEKKYEIYVTTTAADKKANAEFIKNNNLDVKLVTLRTKKYAEILATSKYLINNVSFPVYYVNRDEQISINTWHGTPLKTLGKDMKKGIQSMHNIQHNFLQSTYMLFPNDYTKDCMMKSYNLNELYTKKTIVSGLPRNSVFSKDSSTGDVKKKLNIENKKYYVYMPTWRGNTSSDAMSTNYLDFNLDAFDKALDDDHILYVNLHPNVEDVVDYDKYKHIFRFPDVVPKYDLINESDALITDYSSVFFDYSITRKPIVLFMYDYEDYMEDRGMYIDIKDLPFEKVYDLGKMCKLLKSGEILNCKYDDAKEYFEKFTKYDDINNAKKLVDYVFNGVVDENMKIEDYSKNSDKKWRVIILHGRIDTKEEFDEYISKYNPNKVIFAFRNIYFHNEMNAWLNEEYNDKIVYVVYSYCRLLNKKDDSVYYIEGTSKKRENVLKKSRRRAFERTLPGIKISNKKRIKRII